MLPGAPLTVRRARDDNGPIHAGSTMARPRTPTAAVVIVAGFEEHEPAGTSGAATRVDRSRSQIEGDQG